MIVGGHANIFKKSGLSIEDTALKEAGGLYPTVVKRNNSQVLVVQTNGCGRCLGDITISFDHIGKSIGWYGQPILLNTSVPMNAEVKNMTISHRMRSARKLERSIGNVTAITTTATNTTTVTVATSTASATTIINTPTTTTTTTVSYTHLTLPTNREV